MTSISSQPHNRPPAFRMPMWLRICIPLVILAAGAGVGLYFMETRPAAQRKPAVPPVPLVMVQALQTTKAQERISVMGTVIPEREAEIRSSLAGTLVFMAEDFMPGGWVDAGALMLKVDPADYGIVLEKAKAGLERAKADFELEKGRAAMAEAEVRTLEGLTGSSFSPTDLAFRKPQLRQMEAAIATAMADVSMAEIELERTRILAPFDGVLTRRHVVAGTRVSPGETVATLVGRDWFWVEARMPLDRLSFLRAAKDAEGASKAWIRTRMGERVGHVFRILPDISEHARMARVIVAVKDPLGMHHERPPLFLGDYLSMDLEGRFLEEVFYLPHGSLREGNRIWVVGEDSRLRFLSVVPLFSDDYGVYIAPDVEENSLLVVSDLSLAVEGMMVAVEYGERDRSERVPLNAERGE
ncbi:efflux RND transporter periplasmic adaptor subunit [Desulfobotulus sp. H1]|uniref:Efflux RND transporter periplasmic adaptor subunit n=1 Tax=Desulfobotulus pelophilus TaxID=2823377 RepID=A0ABT3N5F7_9BACT|nr:efflux RND transporter periplasmic adaptor subunit [Desulfobotulus pelophilus]MCW7752689.1 efflux RND transporter periplasmic adaptor subunit [Desulfobotulus pelophilus]